MNSENKTKISAVVLASDWVNHVGAIIKSYLLPASSSLNNLPVLYATEASQLGGFFVVVPEVEHGLVAPRIHIPLTCVLMVFETNKEAMQIGFVSEGAEVSKSGLGHLIKNA